MKLHTDCGQRAIVHLVVSVNRTPGELQNVIIQKVLLHIYNSS
jgi:hypothetical protein